VSQSGSWSPDRTVPGTGDEPELLEKNVKCMESFALPLFRAGHMPVLGEWMALPLVHADGSRRVGDDVFNELFHPLAIRLLDKCDAVLRVGGASAGADEMVRIARERGLDVYAALEEVPWVFGARRGLIPTNERLMDRLWQVKVGLPASGE